ncbi:MAG: radical SAM protein [Bacteroidales bacterium]|nr:radical SAM protein [Bacteroidales bacterium]
MKFLLITPPLTQLNTPYPATTMLKGFLQAEGHSAAQADLGIELVDRLYSKEWLSHYAEGIGNAAERDYLMRCGDIVEQVKAFLRGQDNTLANRIANRSLLPEGARFEQLGDLEWAFGIAGTEDKARHLATLFIEDIADYLRDHTDPHFDLIRYAEQLASYAPTFDETEAALQAPVTMIDSLMLELLEQHLKAEKPDAVGFTIPFPGCLYGALRCAQYIRQNHQVPIILGGGFVNTEWRQLTDKRIFDYCDFITFDDGELPLLRIAELLEGKGDASRLVRTITAQSPTLKDTTENIDNDELPAPDFAGLPLDKYLSLAEMTNPMHRLWSCGRWNKLMMAHGCYWHRCAFCDTSLDYISRYDAPSAERVVSRMESIMAQTGVSGFHFIDEALPPKLLKEVCEEILRRRLTVSFWGNIRFEKAYTAELCDLMAEAGCVAVSGGLEVASDRLLKLMDKGVSIGQTVQACRHFRDAGIMVHTYLMYGFPTETLQETLDALETVRQMFDEGIVQSAFWHRYAMTCHSPSGRESARFGARRTETAPNPFCNNEVDWEAMHGTTDGSQFDYDIEEVGRGLRIATYNYMNGLGLEQPVKSWFPGIRFPKNKKHHSK